MAPGLNVKDSKCNNSRNLDTTEECGGEAFTYLKMNYWLTTINMPWAQRPAYNTARSIRVFIMCWVY